MSCHGDIDFMDAQEDEINDDLTKLKQLSTPDGKFLICDCIV